MSDIKIRRTHTLPHDKARLAAEKMAKRLQKEFNLDYEWEGDVLVFERSGVNGEMTVAPKHVEMEVKLGFMLRMMKPTIEKHIHDNLDEIFAAAAKVEPAKGKAEHAKHDHAKPEHAKTEHAKTEHAKHEHSKTAHPKTEHAKVKSKKA